MAKAKPIRFEHDGTAYSFDMGKCELGDLMAVERAMSMPIDSLLDAGGITAASVIYWLARKQKEPSYTLDDVASLTLDDLREIVEAIESAQEDDKPTPTKRAKKTPAAVAS